MPIIEEVNKSAFLKTSLPQMQCGDLMLRDKKGRNAPCFPWQ